ncbi:NAD(P)H-dependent oxidoreductase [Acanthopleuribacter pedis]|uniref:NAD(P)H-dependent oxidoreductase n=1 Tax=Acanthopleuribacter pedis TaxID=442870 RepID=A0A8J7QBP3_9BACT|nr:NAD(P)H-dependent oxidoreductase [Acanthopleuribacter pedis]MBO1321159.1 NAD(P)H-dependent oxidoreductase [Acanthopleuribacter pedis]
MLVTNILSSHHPKSQTRELVSVFNEELAAQGHESFTYDLYEDGFQPIMRGDDFNQFSGKPLPADVSAIQAQLQKSQVLTLFYPVWWNGMPAIVKGWIDRVFSKSFAYDYGADGTRGLLTFKKVIIVATLGNKKEDVDPQLEASMRFINETGIFRYSGVAETEQHFLYSAFSDEESKAATLERVRDMARRC